MNRTVLITGAGSGFGALTARALATAGHTVYAGMRDTRGRNAARAAAAADYAATHHVDLRSIELDVLSQESADRALGTVVAEAEPLDVVIHSAGHMVTGPAEAFTPKRWPPCTTPTSSAPSV